MSFLEDVLPGDFKAIGIMAPFISGVILTRELEEDEDDDDVDDGEVWSIATKSNTIRFSVRELYAGRVYRNLRE